MIKYLQIKNHKALVHAELLELGNINVICGKNNSGKTTILEALLNEKCYGIGKKIDNVQFLANLFEPVAKNYSTPHPTDSINWFTEYVNLLVRKERIWFSGERENIIVEIKKSQNESFLKRYGEGLFDFDSLLDSFFRNSLTFYNPILIPPKRQLEFSAKINLNQTVSSSGTGIINKLFFLKNQDLESEDYKTYKCIYDRFTEITDSKFNIVPNQDNEINLVYETNGNWIPASDSGLGLSDVLIIVSLLNVLDRNIFLLEEPENHLHAEFQKRLLKYLRTLRSKQFFITTHSSIFLDTKMVDKIYFCENNGEIKVSDHTSKAAIISSLGYSVADNLVADVTILVEGPTDVPVIQEMLTWVGINSFYNIKFWPLGGDIMASLDLSVFAERRNVFALIDSDPGSSVSRTRFSRNCANNGIICKKLQRYSIENYFSINAIRKVFPRQVPTEVKKLSPDESVDMQIGFKDRNKTVKIRNAEIVELMDLSDIEGTDLHDFLIEIKNFLEPVE